jgi:hypothetical protein
MTFAAALTRFRSASARYRDAADALRELAQLPRRDGAMAKRKREMRDCERVARYAADEMRKEAAVCAGMACAAALEDGMIALKQHRKRVARERRKEWAA